MNRGGMAVPPARPFRVLVTKIGFDGHDRGSRLVATFLKEAGMEVIYTPPWQSIPAVVKLAIEEDVDVIGISSLATDHLIVPDMMRALRDAGLNHVGVLLGGIIPVPEHEALMAAGVCGIFGPGATREEITAAFSQQAAHARSRSTGELKIKDTSA